MAEFISALFEFPIILYTVPLILVLAYWAMVILGAADIELLEGADVDVDAGGVGELDLDAAVEAGSADLDADVGIVDGEGSPHQGAFAALLTAIGGGGVPVTVALSLVVLLGWFFTFVGLQLAEGFGLSGTWIALVVLFAGTGGGMVGSALAARPLRPLFHAHSGMRSRELVGRVAILTTQRVDAAFGQAEVADDEGASILVQARCVEENDLQRGSQVMLYDYDATRGVFMVSPLSEGYQSFLEVSRSVKRARPR